MLEEWIHFLNMSMDLIFLNVMQNFVAIRSAVLEKMMLELAIFGNFPDISELKLSYGKLDVTLNSGKTCRVTMYSLLMYNQKGDTVLDSTCSYILARKSL